MNGKPQIREKSKLLELVTKHGRYRVAETPSWATDCDFCDYAFCAGFCPLEAFENYMGYHLVRKTEAPCPINSNSKNQKHK